jgi:cysteine desulfurase/selenocysteine lyase
MCGPTGIGVLYGKSELLDAMPPFQGGGDMIREVKMSGSVWHTLPYKFEAGTPAIAEAIGLGAAVDYLDEVNLAWVQEHDQRLVKYAFDRLSTVEGLHILGPGPEHRGAVIAFTLDGVHPHDLSAILDHDGVAIRAGHHCAQPVHERYGIMASARASMYLYNTVEEMDRLVTGIEKAVDLLAF